MKVHANLLKDIDPLIKNKGRLQTFRDWPFDSKAPCNPKTMAQAGFYFIGNEQDHDLVECFICGKQLDGWEETDDPWEEHKKHKQDCQFININKRDESSFSVEELINLIQWRKRLMLNRKMERLTYSETETVTKYVSRIPDVFKSK